MNLEFLIMRSIYEMPKISQRKLSKDYFVSLGKINSTINSLAKKGLIKKSIGSTSKNTSLYEVTNKGIKEIEKHKVDAAIIFACGMGVRLAPLTYDTPKSFIKVKGERLIERQIEQLIASGINDITIMVGYLKEKFDYLIDKYNVKLVYNREYKNKNTLSTFYTAKELLRNKNVYICVSDVYINENIYHKYEIEPYYIGAFYEDCKNEWRYIVNSKNQIKSVEVGGKNDFCLVGPCFLTKEFLSVFIPMIERYYSMSSTNNYYWEDVLVQNFSKLPNIYMHKLDKDVIYEFDSLKDLNDFDKNSTEFGSEAVSFVSKAFKIKDNEIKNIVCIKEGMTNHSYRFDLNGETYLARVPGENTDTFINRKTEGEILEKLKPHNITEDIIFFDKKTGYKISKFFKNAKTVDISKKDELKKCMALYKKFHLLDINVKASNDISDKIIEYTGIIKSKNIYVPYEDFDDVVSKAYEIKKYLDKVDKVKTLTHGDPNPNNVLIVGNELKLIDFEYGGMANPLSDIALFGVYVGYDFKKTYELYQMYKAVDTRKSDKKIIPKDDNIAKKMIISYMALSGLYNAVWTIVRCAMGDVDFGEFGMAGYRAFKNNYKEFVNL
ncbi:MAG: NTP transferase domain-containing protein [Lachnospiraceae bacterium]|nr:NTP transferase domain-containing protein [Lachnospiraceae bacterium]